MKSHTCDVCGKPIDKDNPAPAPVSSQAAFMIDGKLHQFTYSLRVENFSFTRPGFDFCQKCLLSALANPPAELKPSGALKCLLWLVLSLSFLFCASQAKAQPAGPSIPSASLVGFAVTALSTNSIGVAQPISEFDYVSFTVTVNADTANTSTETFRFVQSYDDGLTYETTPSITYTTPKINGTTPVTYGTNFFCPSSTHIKIFDAWNTNATANFTNTCKFLLKTPKRGANTNVAP